MVKIYKETLLFDFYGELLTERQREIYEAVVLNDYSQSEVAEAFGISRQGVHDMIRRVSDTLAEYEEKLGLVRKFLEIKSKIQRIRQLTDSPEVRSIADEILEEL